ncbi:acetyltransferase, GNAT family [Clostridium sp. ATCC 29733]|nr:acetyltransferase, GNAT family [Clostridium sp. ATCC 29733]
MFAVTGETARLRLRPLAESDADAVFSLTSDAEVARFMRFSQQRERGEAVQLIRDYLASGGWSFAIERKADGRFVGVYAVRPSEGDPARWDMSTFTAKDCWNQGYSSEVLGEIVRLAREALPGITLVGHVVAENRGSRRVLEKNGFSHTETLHFPDMEGEGLCIYQLAL